MAINCYCGLQGSGKSYEAVSSPILDAVANGRRVVTNIDGLNQEKIFTYLQGLRKCSAAQLGSIYCVSNEQITKAAFFPDQEHPEIESIVKGGDMVVIDEAWRFWGMGGPKLSHEHMQFFRMHRHYVHPISSVVCDVVLLTQDIDGLIRSVKAVIEFTFRMHKLKSLGLSKGYRVTLYEGSKQTAKCKIDVFVKRYKPAIFELYSSYAGGSGKENAIDKRQNILANPRLWLVVVGVLTCLVVSAVFAWRFFHRAPATVASPSPIGDISQTAPDPSHSPSSERKTVSDWRIIGSYSASDGLRWVLLANAQNQIRLESPSKFQGNGITMTGQVDGEQVSSWSGQVAAMPIGREQKK